MRSRIPILISDFRGMVAEMAVVAGTREDREALRDLIAPLGAGHMTSGHVPMTYEGPWRRYLALLQGSLGEHAPAAAGLRDCLEGARKHHLAPWVAQLSYDLGRVLSWAGRNAEAAPHFSEALAGAEALGMPGLVARARARLHASPAPAAAPAAALKLIREGEVWRLEAGGRSVRVRHSRGVELLARLVERPGEELHVLALASDSGGALVEGDAGELLDPQAVREYRDRLEELAVELEDATRAQDLGRKARLDREREALQGELSRAVGLGGRGRPAASATERARVNVQRRLKDAVARVAEVDAELGRHLIGSLHTGTYCCFRP
jgi:hypothetical protein